MGVQMPSCRVRVEHRLGRFTSLQRTLKNPINLEIGIVVVFTTVEELEVIIPIMIRDCHLTMIEYALEIVVFFSDVLI